MDIETMKTLHEELPIAYYKKAVEMENASHEFRLAEYNLKVMEAQKFLEFKVKGGTVDEIKAKVVVNVQCEALEVVVKETTFRKFKAELMGIEKEIEGLKELSAFIRREMRTIPTGEIEPIDGKKQF